MKKTQLAALGAVIIACVVLIVGGYAWFTNRANNPAGQKNMGGPVYAYADLEHIMMSHPRYSQYHHLELEYNAMMAEYQFEQWNYSTKAAAQDQVMKQFGGNDMLVGAALDQELKARVALKENELNAKLKQRYDTLVKDKLANQPSGTNEKDLKIVNLKLKLRTVAMSADERKATEQELYQLMRADIPNSGLSDKAVQEITAEMAPYKAKMQQELASYAAQVKEELQRRQQGTQDVFKQQMGLLGDRPEPMIWNQEWKDKLSAKEKEMDDEKDAILADIRDKAAVVAQEQGIEIVFSDYLGFGTATDITDDIIVKLG